MKYIAAMFGSLLLLGIVIGVVSYITYSNKGVEFEQAIQAQLEANKIRYSEFTQSAIEQMQVADKYKDALKELITAAIEGRYGENGSQAVVQAMQERYPGELDVSLFASVQDTIRAGRIEFAHEQRMLVSKITGYKMALNYFWSGMWLKFTGHPKIDLDAPEFKSVLSGQTHKTFETGIDDGIKF